MKDQLDRTIKLKAVPKRIVSLVPSQTELLCDLGLENAIVGVTKFCVHPNHLLKTKTIVGGTKQIKLDRIEALKPDIILCNKEENTEGIVEACATICPVHVSDIITVEDCLELILQYGVLFKATKRAQKITTDIKARLKQYKTFVDKVSVLKTAYFIWKDPWMVAGKYTFINELLSLNKFDNKYAHLERYPEVDLEELHDIDLILLSSEPYPFKEKHVEILQSKFANTNVQLVDGEFFSWYGSRLVKAFDYFKALRSNFL